MISLRLPVLLVILFLLPACGGPIATVADPPAPTHNYVVDGVTYHSTAEALAAMDRAWEARRAGVQPRKQVAESILVCAPSDDALGRPPYHTHQGDGPVDAETLRYVVAVGRKQFEHRARVLERAGLFARVIFQGTDDCVGYARGLPAEWALERQGQEDVLVRVVDGARYPVTTADAQVFAAKVAEVVGAGQEVARTIAEPRRAPEAAPGGDRPRPAAGPLVAVMDVDVAAAGFAPALVGPLTDYLATKVAETGRFRVVSRGQLSARLGKEKVASYQACYEQACQIELGKALAAEQVLATRVLKLGSRCSLTGSLFDLKTEATLRAAAVDLDACSEGALQKAAAELARRMGERAGSPGRRPDTR